MATLAGAVAISPDGRTLAFVGRPSGNLVGASLYVRSLDRLDAQQLAGTEAAVLPFFSPDGRWIAFFAGAVLKKVAVSGGSVVTLCDAASPRGGWWGEEDVIVFASATGLYRVAGSGGAPQQISAAEPAEAPLLPQLLPRGRGILYTESANSDPAGGTIVHRDLSGGSRTEVIQGGRSPRYLASGHLTFVRSGSLFAVPFDLDALQVTGEAVPLVEGLLPDGNSRHTERRHCCQRHTRLRALRHGNLAASVPDVAATDRQSDAASNDPGGVYPSAFFS